MHIRNNNIFIILSFYLFLFNHFGEETLNFGFGKNFEFGVLGGNETDFQIGGFEFEGKDTGECTDGQFQSFLHGATQMTGIQI